MPNTFIDWDDSNGLHKMVLISALQCILYLLVVPFCIGTVFARFTDKKLNTIGNILLFGFISELSVFQLLFLAAYFFDTNLTVLTWASSTVLFAFALISFIINFKVIKEISLPKFDLGLAVFACFTVYMVVMRNLQGVNDGDDAYVLGNALLTLSNGHFYKLDYYTGMTMNSTGYMRHLLSGNSIFIAYIAKVTFIHPTILAHRVLGSFYIVLHNMLIFNIGRLLFKKDERYAPYFASLVSLITIWDFHSFLSDSTFILSRTWQGKAMFVSFSIPLLLLILLNIGAQEKEKAVDYVLIAILCIASVFMTPAAIILLSLPGFVGAVFVSAAKKKFTTLLYKFLFKSWQLVRQIAANVVFI